MSDISVRFELRRDTAANWTAGNVVLLSGEPGVETDTGRLKVGNGTTSWTSLPYLGSEQGVMQNLANLLPWSQLQAYAPKVGWKGTEPGVPSAPSATVVAGGTAGTITVSWTTPASNGGSAITGYNVYLGTAAAAEWPMPVNATAGAVASGSTSVASTASSLTISGLTTGTTYYAVVGAVTANGIGAGSAEVHVAAP